MYWCSVQMSSLLLLMINVLCGLALHLVSRCCKLQGMYGEKSDDNRSFRNEVFSLWVGFGSRFLQRGFKRLIFVGANYGGVAISASRQ